MEQESLRSSLREGTRGLHARLDTALTGTAGQVTDLAGYLRVLRSLHSLHAHADAALQQWAGSSIRASSLDVALLPDRTGAYAADLATLGEPAPPQEKASPDPVDDARGLALLYLVSGSAAGARVLLRGLPDAVPVEARRGLTDAAGRSSTTLWREAVSLLEQPSEPELQEAVVAEAGVVLHLLLDLQETGGQQLMTR